MNRRFQTFGVLIVFVGSMTAVAGGADDVKPQLNVLFIMHHGRRSQQ